MLSSIKLIFVCLVLILVLTIFIPPTAFCDTKSETIGTTGVLSIGPNGNIYIQFTESHTKSTAGNFIMGIPEGLTQTQSDQHDFMQASYNAYNAWLKCEEAKKKAADGKITKVQMEFECTRYNLYNSKEVSIWATAILDNNMGKDIPLAATMSEISKLEIEKYNQILSDLTDLGAEPTVLGYEPPGEFERFTNYDLKDPIIVTDKVVLDYVPLSDSDSSTPVQ